MNPEADGKIFTENVFVSDLGVRHWRPKFDAVTGEAMQLPGTQGYIPPEVYSEGQAALGPATDIWALGCIGFELFAGIQLFEDEFAVDRFTKQGGAVASRQGEIIRYMRDNEPKVHSILNGCLQPDPTRRSTIWRVLSEVGPIPPKP